MLILTRRVGETLIVDLGDDQAIKFTILGVKGNQVRVGIDAPRAIPVHIDAPRAIPVHRSEIYERIKAGKTKPALKAVANG